MICGLSFIIATEVTLFWGRRERLIGRPSWGGYAPWGKACARSFVYTFTRTITALRNALYLIMRVAGMRAAGRVAGTGSLTPIHQSDILKGQRTCPCDPHSCDPAKFTWGGGKIYSFWHDGRFGAAVVGRIVRFGRIGRCGALRHTERMDFRTCWLQFGLKKRRLAELNKNSAPAWLLNLTQFPWYCWGKAVLLHVNLRDLQQEEKIRL
jgi:hypothetical protein